MARRRVAVAIDIGSALRHHIDIYAGIHRFVREHAGWDYELDPFVAERQRDKHARYDGIIARATPAIAARARRAGVPIVNVWSASPLVGSIPTVMADYAAAGRMAAEHLLSRGYRRLAFQGIRRNPGSRAMRDAFAAVAARAGVSWSAIAISAGCDETHAAWERYLARVDAWIGAWTPPLGVFVAQDIVCRYLAAACRRNGIRVPEDAALIGLGNEPAICSQPEPSLSSIDVGFERIGYEAAALLERLMSGQTAPAGPVLVAPKTLVLRRSTDLWVVANESVAAALKFIAAHRHERISVADVARGACAAVRSLERAFRDTLGRTVKDEIVRQRMEMAKKLLVDLDEPIKVVARSCGFSGATYFHEAFMRAEGLTPRQFRLLRRGGISDKFGA